MRRTSRSALKIEGSTLSLPISASGGPTSASPTTWVPLEVDRRLLAHWPVVKMLHGYFGTCVSGLKMHAFPTAQVCERTFGPACLALYFPRRCGQLSPGAMMEGYRWASEQRALLARYTAAVVASRHMRDEMARHGVPERRLNVLPMFSTLRKPCGGWRQ